MSSQCLILISLCLPLVVLGADPPGKKAKDKEPPKVDCKTAKPGNAVCYAQEVKNMLGEYIKQTAADVKRRRTEYDTTAELFDRDTRGQVDSQMLLLRTRLTAQVTKSLLAGRMGSWDWRRPLGDYIEQDFERSRTLLSSGIEHGVSEAFLIGIEDLKTEVEKAKKLSDLVELLATPRDLKDELEQWFSYGKDVRDEYQKKACAAVKAQSAPLTGALTQAKMALDNAKKAVPQVPDDIDKALNELNTLTAKDAAVKGYLKDKNCGASAT